MSSQVVPATVGSIRRVKQATRKIDSDLEWQKDVWASYALQERRIPSSDTGSASSDDFHWGPDLPKELLLAGTSCGEPWHPFILNKNRKPIRRGCPKWRQEVSRWSKERTEGLVRSHPKPKHCFRSRRRSRERYSADMKKHHAENLTLDWDFENGGYRKLEFEDIVLPPLDTSSDASSNSSFRSMPPAFAKQKTNPEPILNPVKEQLRSIVVVPVTSSPSVSNLDCGDLIDPNIFVD